MSDISAWMKNALGPGNQLELTGIWTYPILSYLKENLVT